MRKSGKVAVGEKITNEINVRRKGDGVGKGKNENMRERLRQKENERYYMRESGGE